jgi:hypothetical protein
MPAETTGIETALQARPKCKNTLSVLKGVGQDFLKTTTSGVQFQQLFLPNCQEEAIAGSIRRLLPA